MRESRKDSDQPRSWPPAALSASLDVLTGAAQHAHASKVAEPLRHEAIAAVIAPAAREAAAAGVDKVRRIVISPGPSPIDMPPLRH